MVLGDNDYYPFGLTFNSYQRENSAVKNVLGTFFSGDDSRD